MKVSGRWRNNRSVGRVKQLSRSMQAASVYSGVARNIRVLLSLLA